MITSLFSRLRHAYAAVLSLLSLFLQQTYQYNQLQTHNINNILCHLKVLNFDFINCEMPASKKTKEVQRVVCRCRYRECYQGHFIDAYGERQSGVEVLLSTRDAHARADLRKKALEPDSEPSSSAITHSQTPDDLVAPLLRLHIPALEPRLEGTLQKSSGHTTRTKSEESLRAEASTEHATVSYEAPVLQSYDCGMSLFSPSHDCILIQYPDKFFRR